MHQVQSPADLPIRSGRAHTPRRDPQAAGEEIPLRVLGNSERNRNAIAMDLAKGAVAGAVAWWAMDQTLRLLYDHEGPAVREQEDWARGGVPALERVAEGTAGLMAVRLPEKDRRAAGTALQWMVGIGAGALYGALRSRVPSARAGRGLAFGAVFSLALDEGLIPLLGFAPGPTAFPWQTHARGVAGHLVFGVVADATLELLDGA